MADSFRVVLDLEKIRANFERVEKLRWTEAGVREWLVDCGFVDKGDYFICEEISLDAIDKSEIIHADPY